MNSALSERIVGNEEVETLSVHCCYCRREQSQVSIGLAVCRLAGFEFILCGSQHTLLSMVLYCAREKLKI